MPALVLLSCHVMHGIVVGSIIESGIPRGATERNLGGREEGEGAIDGRTDGWMNEGIDEYVHAWCMKRRKEAGRQG